MKEKFFHKLSVKLVLVSSLVLIIILIAHTYVTIRFIKKDLYEIYQEGVVNLSDIIKSSTRYSMLLNKRNDIYEIIRTVGNEPGVKRVRIYNKMGIISYSSDSAEIGRLVEIKSEACIACHGGGNPKKSLEINEGIRVFNYSENERVIGMINPIQNEPDCYSADCHAHDKNKEILGVLDVMTSMKKADDTVASGEKNIILNSVFIIVILASVSGFYIYYMVNKPLAKFKEGITELGKGNWNHRIHIKSKNEFGVIAHQFNDMSRKLSTAYEEIKSWSETLNQKVEEKTDELKNVYHQIIQMEKLASLGKLSATVAHELNNPLEGILTYSKLVAKKLKNEDEFKYKDLIKHLNLISDESARCGRIVKDLLSFSHSGDEEMNNCDLVNILDKCISLVNHHLEINNIELIKNYGQKNLLLRCNSQKIQQCLMSVLINAIESMAGIQGGKLEVSLTSDKSQAIIRIKDSGTGISEKDLPHIFEPFYTTKDAISGTGLGLSVVYGIINSHHGKIEVEETSNKGTTFKITLPFDLNNFKNEKT
jgi:two-component system NtrC family sensor kinase